MLTVCAPTVTIAPMMAIPTLRRCREHPIGVPTVPSTPPVCFGWPTSSSASSPWRRPAVGAHRATDRREGCCRPVDPVGPRGLPHRTGSHPVAHARRRRTIGVRVWSRTRGRQRGIPVGTGLDALVGGDRRPVEPTTRSQGRGGDPPQRVDRRPHPRTRVTLADDGRAHGSRRCRDPGARRGDRHRGAGHPTAPHHGPRAHDGVGAAGPPSVATRVGRGAGRGVGRCGEHS